MFHFFNILLWEIFGIIPDASEPLILHLRDVSDEYDTGLLGVSSIRVCAEYEVLSATIKRWKYEKDERAGESLMDLLLQAVPNIPRVDAIVGIPIGINRYIERGFNQSKRLTNTLATATKIPQDRGLICWWSTRHQARLTLEERHNGWYLCGYIPFFRPK